MVGINYWPRETGIFWWRRFDPSIVERDFSLLSAYRFETVRIFLLWEDFQPEEHRVSVASLNHLVQVADLADGLHLQILPTLFTGHMRGVNWLPPWMLESGAATSGFSIFSDGEVREAVGIRNMYDDRNEWKAQKRLIREVIGALQGHPAVWGWDLGNEPSNLVLPPSRDAAWAWLEEMVVELKRYDSDIPVTLGLHQKDLEEDRIVGPREAARFCDVLSVHSYPCYARWADSAVDEKASIFLAIVSRWLGEKPVLLEEFGIPTDPGQGILSSKDQERLNGIELVSEDDAATYCEKVLTLVGAHSLLGALVWCFSDYEPALWESPPLDRQVHERFFGLFRWNGSPKVAAGVVPTVDRHSAETQEKASGWIDIKPDEYYQRPLEHLKRLYNRFKDNFQEA
jgi:endo-1,4-beta-mannosidase